MFISFLSISCANLPKHVPNDFQLLIKSTPLHPGETGNYTYLIKKKTPKDDFELIQNYDDTNTNIGTNIKLSASQVQRLYDEVRNAKVFRLKNSYEDMNVLDGSNSTLTINANGKTKIINMRNTHPVELEGVFSILTEIESELNSDQ